jgi:hypothetical protein
MKRIVMVGVAVAALLATGPATGASVAGGQPGNDSARERCADGTSANARLMQGATATDPNTVTTAQARSMDRALQARLASLSRAERARRAPVTVKVYWHIIRTNNGTVGNVTNARIRQQLRVLNDSYSGATAASAANTRFRFATEQITRTNNTQWYNWGNPYGDPPDPSDDVAAKTALHRGGSRALNVYLAQLDGGLLGYATFPDASIDELDGVVVLNASLPGGAAAPYNLGDTLTHEVGHWLNLFHTFQGSCGPQGDQVDDTPRQFAGNNIFECDTSLDTCTATGKDPVKNFMNYVDDACMVRFTPGQAARASQSWNAFRR